MEQGAEDAAKHIHQLEEELGLAQETINKLTALEQQNSKDVKALAQQVEAAREREHQMEEAVEVAEEKLSKDGEVILDLRNRLASLERERQRDASTSSRSSAGIVYTATEYEALEHELDDANREKAKLRALLDQSPARKAIEKAKDLKIELLQREKEELLERNRTLRMTVNEIGTPNKLINASGISPIHRHVLSMSMRMPKTPGTPLRDVSLVSFSVLNL
jgi:chromosome segregation ATPase